MLHYFSDKESANTRPTLPLEQISFCKNCSIVCHVVVNDHYGLNNISDILVIKNDVSVSNCAK